MALENMKLNKYVKVSTPYSIKLAFKTNIHQVY